jgi:hypothetical protein
MEIVQMKDQALSIGFSVNENGLFLTVSYAMLITNKQSHQTSGPWDYVAFGIGGEVIAIGHEDADNRCGGWTWIQNRMDSSFGNLVTPPETHIFPFPLLPQQSNPDGLHIVGGTPSFDRSPPYQVKSGADFSGAKWQGYAYHHRDAQGYLIDALGNRIASIY